MDYIILLSIFILGIIAILLQAAALRRISAQNAKNEELKQALKKENEELKSFLLRQNSDLRQELSTTLTNHISTVNDGTSRLTTVLQNQMESFSQAFRDMSENNRRQLNDMRQTMENNLTSLQKDNAEKLEKMRQTVDEKLNSTLEKRLSESFSSVSKQLENVYKGLGEMQTLASSVGDLKSALTNVKVRGTWGEVSLENLLDQLLTPEQYKKNVKPVPRSNNIVEFCICLPNNENNNIVYLPIDCKFPIEQYIRLCDASEKGDAAAAENASKQMDLSIKTCARTIRDKYIAPPYTTDFAIMYLPIEGLYAEVARRSGLCEQLQREYRVTVAGPTTLGAFLNSLQLGFKTLAIQKRTSEITVLLTKIKSNFGKFADLLEKTKRRLDDASANIEDATKRYYKIDNLLGKADSFALQEQTEAFGSEISQAENSEE